MSIHTMYVYNGKELKMKRSITRDIERGQKLIEKHPNADLSTEELVSICNEFRTRSASIGTYDAAWKVVKNIFYMGVAVGSRNS